MKIRALSLISAALLAGCQTTAEMPAQASKETGAFAGELKLCEGTVAEASRAYDETTGQTAMDIVFNPSAALKFSAMTSKYVGQELPVILNERTIISPIIMEPIRAGRVQLSLGELREFDELLAAMKQPC